MAGGGWLGSVVFGVSVLWLPDDNGTLALLCSDGEGRRAVCSFTTDPENDS